jgi:ubiquinone/menaquinone biosynthesis C-methylase UbiE
MPQDQHSHYDRLADQYNDNWAYSPAFIKWMTGHLLDRLKLRPGERVADIGCGTGLYAKGLAERAGRVLCIDPSPNMLAQLPGYAGLQPIQASAEDLAAGRVTLPYGQLDVVLIKEVIHHVRDRAAVLNGLARLLAPQGRLLVVMLPTQIEYPLFSAALELFERLQPDPEAITTAICAAGLHVDFQYESFALSFEKSRYLSMVRSRYMSLLASFDDDELERGVAEIDERYPAGRLTYRDRQAFILGVRG